MTRTLTALIAAFTVTATLTAASVPALADGVEATRGFLSSGHSSGITAASPVSPRGIANGDLGSGRSGGAPDRPVSGINVGSDRIADGPISGTDLGSSR